MINRKERMRKKIMKANNVKRVLTTILAATLAATSVTACGSGSSNTSADVAGNSNDNANAVEQWNEKNLDQTIDITYSDADTAVWLQHVEDGSVDFSIIDGPMYTAYVDEYGFDLGKAEIPEEEASLISDNLYAYFILPKDQTELRDKLDGAILELKQNGTLKELSEKSLVEQISHQQKMFFRHH